VYYSAKKYPPSLDLMGISSVGEFSETVNNSCFRFWFGFQSSISLIGNCHFSILVEDRVTLAFVFGLVSGVTVFSGVVVNGNRVVCQAKERGG